MTNAHSKFDDEHDEELRPQYDSALIEGGVRGKYADMTDEHTEYRIFLGRANEWFHGSPLRLDVLAEGSTITPVIQLAEAFSHKPPNLEWDIAHEDGERWITITHNGEHDGFLFRVVVDDPEADIFQHPTSVFAPGEEMLTSRPLRLEFIRELPLDRDNKTIRFPAPRG
jgi:hypothetical protein